MTVTDKIAQLIESPRPWLTDGGLETDMVFNHGVDLPSFASFTMLDDADKRRLLADYFTHYIDLAAEAGTGFVLDTCTWRAGAAWLERMGYDEHEVARINTDAVEFCNELRAQHTTANLPVIINE